MSILAKPTIDYLQTTADLTVRAGLPVTLSCAARGSPEPLVIWQKVGGTMIPGIGMNNPVSYITFFTIKRVMPVPLNIFAQGTLSNTTLDYFFMSLH